MKAITPNSSIEYICKEDLNRPKKEQTVFRIKQLSVSEEAFIEDQLGKVKKGGDFAVSVGTQSLIALHIGLIGVDNLQNGDGKPITFQRDQSGHPIFGAVYPWKNKCLSAIPRRVRNEVAQYIINGGELEEDEL